MENNQTNEQPAAVQPAKPAANYVLPASILIAAVLIAGSVIYAFGGDRGSSTGEKKFPTNAFSKCVDDHKYAEKVQTDRNAAQAAGVGGTPATYVNGQFINGAQPWDVFQAAIEKALKTEKPEWPDMAVDAVTGEKVKNVAAINDQDVVLGDPNAPVTIIEYGDYQCPFCARYFTELEPRLRETYINSGKAKMVFRNYAFLGPESQAAAEAAECAKEQGKFWQYHDELYTREHLDGQEHNGNLNRSLFLEIAQKLELKAK